MLMMVVVITEEVYEIRSPQWVAIRGYSKDRA